jgi:heme-degrading monooxygenase HmoA
MARSCGDRFFNGVIMFVVIFRAEIAQLDDDYLQMAARLRELALRDYGCLEFTGITEGQQEVALSYWESETQIKQWKQDAEHLLAQQSGRAIWYKNYRVEIAEIRRAYGSS